jgi:hypothetical protein
MLRYKSNSTQIADLKYFMINTHAWMTPLIENKKMNTLIVAFIN